MNPSLPANSQSVDPNLPGYVPVPRPNIAMDAPSTVPQTNQGGQRPSAVQMHYSFPPAPQCFYITPRQLSMILTVMKAQGIYPAGAEIKRDADQMFLPDSMGDGTYYSLYWRDEQGLHADQLGYLYHEFQDHLVAAQRVSNPFPVMVRHADNGTIGFK